MGILSGGSKSESPFLSPTRSHVGISWFGADIYRIQDITPDEEREFEAAAMEAARNRPTPAPSPSPAPAPAAQSIQLPTSNPNVSTTHPIPMQLPAAPVSGPVPGAGPTPLEDTAHTTEEYMTICRAFIDQLRSGSAPWLLQRLNNTYGTMPEDPSEFSYWMALVRFSYLPGTGTTWLGLTNRLCRLMNMRKLACFPLGHLDSGLN
jgi:hypothetical protein